MKSQGHTSARAAQIASRVSQHLNTLSIRQAARQFKLAEKTVRKIAAGQLVPLTFRCRCGGKQLAGQECLVCRDRAALQVA